jgi:hypothetical protein
VTADNVEDLARCNPTGAHVRFHSGIFLALIGALGCGAGITQDTTGGEAVSAETKPAMVVYDKALGPGWQNWSWAKTELSTELSGSSRKPIKVEAGPWQAMYLHHDPFSTTGYKQLGMLIQGSSAAADARVFALIDGKVNGEGRLVKFGNTGWTKVVIPLAELGVEDKTIDGIWIQNGSPVDLPKFYVTEIQIE